jgi:squalene-hopene/tetraprenyl-beta-curcumene cyclase
MSGLHRERLQRAVERVNRELLAAIGPDGHWVGELSSSALSTATAVTALAMVQRESQITSHQSRITSGLAWLTSHQNADGGWGDTVLSLSNLSTTTLCWAAFGAVPGADERFSATVQRAERWIAERIAKQDRQQTRKVGRVSPSAPFGGGSTVSGALGETRATAMNADTLARAIIARYGKDRTFSVPILTMCALAGRLGAGRDAWKHVIPLPFELAACPHSWFAALRLPVVSYALPALIAIGQVRHVQSPSRNPFVRLIRNFTREFTLRKLERIQPTNGGFLEATPLTSFVTMSLAGSGQVNHPVTKRGVEFLIASQRPDGSWPIDTNLATWVTTLAVNALGKLETRNSKLETQLRSWLLNQQYRAVHPYTHAAPGGWAWTDLPGGVPDADDTAGALLALRKLGPIDNATREAAIAAITWLLDLQNRDGGIPTFCRGWGALPFDQSSADITAHAVRAWLAWFDDTPAQLQTRILDALRKTIGFFDAAHNWDGSWSPLWFGNQHAPDDTNLTYGTSRIVRAMEETTRFREKGPGSPLMTFNARVAREFQHLSSSWLLKHQRQDGSWGQSDSDAGSIEETALALDALAFVYDSEMERARFPNPSMAIQRGVEWLLARVESGEWTKPSPIGFYFAKLWYYEKLYPMIFAVGALNRVSALLEDQPQRRDSAE